MMKSLTTCLLLPLFASAQTPPPAPGGEAAPSFSSREAFAFAMAARLAESWRAGETRMLAGSERVGSYERRVARRAADGTLRWHDYHDDPARMFQAGEALAYFVPIEPVEWARRIVCVRGDGVIAFTDNAVGTTMRGGRELLPDDVLGGGGKGSLRDFPRTPTRGRDGNFWMPGEMAPQVALRVTVVDEAGEPLAGVHVATVVADDGQGVEAVMPAGSARTLLEGDAVLRGVPARGLGFVITMQGISTALTEGQVRVEGTSARLVVSRALLQQVVWKRNESAAIATLKNISSAQAQCQASGVIDVNGNGAGEYGTFAELAGRDVVRGGKAKMSPPVLSTAFARIEQGVVQRNGYCFRIFLPGKDGVPVAEKANGGADAAAIDAGRAETVWCVYAWPIEAGVTGQRAFCIDQSGDVLGCPNADGRYSGPAKVPAADAVRRADSDGKLSAPAAANAAARDGQTWVVIG